ncbi:MAG: right-handed parallel beta-helix repeat-containing protein [Candidatus Eiseniibacteriota bacterium]
MESLSITGAASAGSGVFADNAGRLVLRACGVSGITSSGHSGAVEVQNCDLLLEDCEASFNVSGGAAGVYAVDCSIEILRCRFEGNQGRAVELSGTGNNDSAVILDCEFIDNRMSVDGAAVGLVDPYTVQVERNLFLRNVNTSDTGGGLWVTYSFGTIRYNTFAYDSTYGNGGAAGLLFGFFNGDVSNNTFVGCHAPATTTGSAVVGMGSAGIFNFSNNLFVNCTGAAAIGIFAPLPGSCNGFWNNEGGVGDYIPSATDVFLDPRFCDAPSLDFTLDAQSPYAAGNNTTCGQVGAFGVGCGSVAVRAMTWGQLKTLYR